MSLHSGSTTRQAQIQFRVIWALALRESLTRYGRHNVGFLWLFGEPMIFTLGITAFWTLTQAVHGSDLPIVPFAVTGYSSVLLWRNMPGRLLNGVSANAGLMHHRNVRLTDIYFARLLLESGGVTMSFAFLSLFFMSVGWMKAPEDVLEVIWGWLLLNWFGWSLGLTLGSVSERSEIIEKLWHPLTYFLFPLSGAAFIVSGLPESAQSYVLLLPMVHAVEIIREGFFGSAFKAHYDIWYLVAWNATLTLIGLSNTLYLSRRVTPS
jgi:ABC-2 type transport system permease protein/capsular polysaccharide transport system permease protein